MRRRAVALHARAEERQPTEDGIQRIQRTGAGDDEHVGALGTQRLQLLGNAPRRRLGEPHTQQPAPEPVDLLPEGGLEPIALPGLASLRAAMQPAKTRALYYVSRGDGTSEFSRSLEEHNRAVSKYQLQPRKK